MENIINDTVKLLNDWNALGTLAAVIALLQIIMKALKLKILNDIFVKYKIKWIKPYIAVTIGAIIGGLSTYSTGAQIPQSIAAGMIAATTSVGWNEIVNKIQADKRKE